MIAALLLAAGSARRFGAQKLLARLPDGRHVVEASAANLRAAGCHVVAVVRRDETLMQVLSRAGCEVVVNERAEEGMGTSIACGMSASAVRQGCLIALGDMPRIAPATIADVAARLSAQGGIVVPRHEGREGHPVGFSSAFDDDLRMLAGDRGARSILSAHAAQVRYLDVDDAGVLFDIDVPSDLP